jgi:hypothetical protein
LPKEIVDFGKRYGTGMFGDNVEVFNPFSSKYLQHVETFRDCYCDLKRTEGDEFIPYAIYPQNPGLLVCGSDVNGHSMFWLTEGPPDEWPLVLMSRHDNSFERLEMSLTTFLAKVFSGAIDCVLWDREWLKNN